MPSQKLSPSKFCSILSGRIQPSPEGVKKSSPVVFFQFSLILTERFFLFPLFAFIRHVFISQADQIKLKCLQIRIIIPNAVSTTSAAALEIQSPRLPRLKLCDTPCIPWMLFTRSRSQQINASASSER